VHVSPAGVVTVLTIVVEMGQGSQSGIAQLVADELDVAWRDVRVEMAPFERRYTYRYPATGGSTAIRESFEPMRRVGAAARAMLVRAAASTWGVSADDCTTREGRVLHAATGRSLGYGEVAERASRLRVPQNPPLKSRAAWSLIGREVSRLDAASKCDGSAKFGTDVVVPGMLHAAIAHAPVRGGTLVSLDDAPARAVRGVRHVVRQPGFVAVVAGDWWTASRALATLRPEWLAPEGSSVDDDTLRQRLLAALDTPGTITAPAGPEGAARVREAQAAFAGAARVIERIYEVPLLAQAALEPLGALAIVNGDRAEIHTSTQDPAMARTEVAAALALDPRHVTIRTPFLGGGFGRRIWTDYAVEAALIAREAGAPVKLMWSREEDFAHSAFRPASACRMRAAISPSGDVLALHRRVAVLGDTLRAGAADCPYAIHHLIVEASNVPVPLRLGSWRSVDASQHVYFLESFVDELAVELGRSPLELRRSLLRHDPRAIRVLDAVARASSYEDAPREGGAQGVALCVGFGSITAQVCTVARMPDGAPRVTHVHSAIDCGTPVNPGSIRAQFEGGVNFALGAAAWQRIAVAGGRVTTTNFDRYAIGTIADAPVVETLILESPDAPVGGVGEPPVPGIAPALCSAVARLTGERPRRLPVFPRAS
jgi:isoquinoline 1-oxidoreductase beta subunit